MRPTKEALIKKVCKDMELIEYHVVDVLSDKTLQQQINDNPDKVIFGIVEGKQVDNKLFLTSHQFSNIVGTDIYIYIGNVSGQNAYQMLLEDMSRVRRLDEKLLTFLREECNDYLTEIDLSETLSEKIPEKITTTVSQTPNNLIYVLLSETMINKGIADILLNNHFDAIGDSHLFIYTDNATGTQMLTRLLQESLENEH